MRTFTYLMGRECTLRIVLLCLFFISELLYIQLLDTKIPNNGELFVYIGKYKYTILQIKLHAIIYQYGFVNFSSTVPQFPNFNSNGNSYMCFK